MTVPPAHPAYTDSHPVWVHLMTLAAVAIVGIIVAVALGFAVIPWPETVGIGIWFFGLCILTASSLSNRVVR